MARKAQVKRTEESRQRKRTADDLVIAKGGDDLAHSVSFPNTRGSGL